MSHANEAMPEVESSYHASCVQELLLTNVQVKFGRYMQYSLVAGADSTNLIWNADGHFVYANEQKLRR